MLAESCSVHLRQALGILDCLDLMSMGAMPVGANDVRDVASPFSSVLSTTVNQMQWLIGPLLDIIYPSFCRTAPSVSSVHHSIEHSLDRSTVWHSTDMTEQPHLPFYDYVKQPLFWSDTVDDVFICHPLEPPDVKYSPLLTPLLKRQ